MYQADADPYCYPDSSVLKNKAGLTTEIFTTQEITFVRATGESLTLTHKLCIDASDHTRVCVTGESQVRLAQRRRAPECGRLWERATPLAG